MGVILNDRRLFLCIQTGFVIDLNAMNLVLWLALLVHLVISPLSGWFQTDGEAAVISPQPDSVLQGAVEVSTTLDVATLSGYEVSFGYAAGDSKHWFLIAQGGQPAPDGGLAVWDTTLITDGNYRLLVRVIGTDGAMTDYLVDNLRVRNYTPVETMVSTIVKTQAVETATATLEPSPTAILPTSTAFAPNPGAVNQEDIAQSVLRGVGYTAMAFIVLGLYLTLKRRRPHR